METASISSLKRLHIPLAMHLPFITLSIENPSRQKRWQLTAQVSNWSLFPFIFRTIFIHDKCLRRFSAVNTTATKISVWAIWLVFECYIFLQQKKKSLRGIDYILESDVSFISPFHFPTTNILSKLLCGSSVRRIRHMGALFSSTRGVATTMATQFVNGAIASDKVVIFSKSYCPYCQMAKEVRTMVMNDFFLVSIDWMPNFVFAAIQQIATTIHGHWIGKSRWLWRNSGCIGPIDGSYIGEIASICINVLMWK